MEHRVIAGEYLLLGGAEMVQDIFELAVADVGFIVHDGPVVDYEHFFLRHHLGGFEGQALFVELVLDDEILELLHGDAVAEGADAEAGDQLGSGLGYGDDLPAVLGLELFKDPAYEGGFACGGAAGENDPGDFLYHIHLPFKISGSRPGAGSGNILTSAGNFFNYFMGRQLCIMNKAARRRQGKSG